MVQLFLNSSNSKDEIKRNRSNVTQFIIGLTSEMPERSVVQIQILQLPNQP